MKWQAVVSITLVTPTSNLPRSFPEELVQLVNIGVAVGKVPPKGLVQFPVLGCHLLILFLLLLHLPLGHVEDTTQLHLHTG